MSTKSNKLPDISDLNQKFSNNSIPSFLRTNKEVYEWLKNVFKWKDSGEIGVRLSDIGGELSDYTGRDITGDHVSRAYNRWKKTGNL